MTDSPAPSFVEKTAKAADFISIYDLKTTAAATKLCAALERGKIVPLARTSKDGGKIETIMFAVPPEALAAKARTSSSTFSWGRIRRNPREASEAARILQRALWVSEGLKNDDDEVVPFFVVPDDAEPKFSDLEEDREQLKVHALQRMAEAMEELSKGILNRT